ncbi:MAG: SGNH/GDSL hydrolase family protein [Methylobacter sp.]|nr:SGNH/GDSL hydrolase family protein [Methylobacter sp.]MDP2098655.1 SGNH/GDSL hydrolase family protein [Methylobacter sp.]MDP2428925.1 SGNH/GDSL hydrolase family protein [Methylobacter sp.]MDP3056119.1 SGNH/GDSL hydrolase family protein [Methylobacter sp.]MDP3363456.1 SGNH/GDSL hydrolase family protein [Methylobacter sp.]
MQEILVLGDSHSPVFNHPLFKETFPTVHFNVVTVIGATASGLENPNSTTQAYPIFRVALKNTAAKHIIVMLGEVDTGFVIWYRAQKYQESVAAMLDKAIASYCRFLAEINSAFEVICISAPLPTIQDGNDWGDIANARREVTASQVERTALTLEFNWVMQAFCLQNSIRYLMLDSDSLGECGIVKADLLNNDCNNHHYDQDQYSRLLADGLIGMI